MPDCDKCGTDESMPYECNFCGATLCGDHRLPEKHDCTKLDRSAKTGEDAIKEAQQTNNTTSRIRASVMNTSNALFSRFNGLVSYLFLAIMGIVFVAELLVITLGSQGLFSALFVLSSDNPEYVWTWVTSIFAHSPAGFGHIFGNALILFFFGPFLEKRIGSKQFTVLFLVSGILAGLGQIASGFLLGNPVSGVLGASGAIMAILGAITVINPRLTVYLYFIIPTPVWVITLGYAGLSVFGVLGSGLMTNVAHVAHLLGLVIGLAYGYRVSDRVSTPNQFELGGGNSRKPPRKRF